MAEQQRDFVPIWQRREALEEHLQRIGLRPPLRLLLLHLWETGQHDGSLTLRQASRAELARELRCSLRAVVDWRDDLAAYGFLATIDPPRGRKLITVVDWQAVWDCDRIADAGPPPADWLKAVGPTPAHGAPDDAAHGARDDAPHDARNGAPDDARNGAGRSGILIGTGTEGKNEGENPSINLSQDARGAELTHTLATLPARVWDPATGDAALYAILKAWRAANSEAVEAHDLTPERFVASILATRSGNPRMPLQYLLTCLESPGEKWLHEARRWLAYQQRTIPYAAHGVAR